MDNDWDNVSIKLDEITWMKGCRNKVDNMIMGKHCTKAHNTKLQKQLPDGLSETRNPVTAVRAL